MQSMTVYQYDSAGRYLGETEADESPLEPGVYLRPARTTDVAPPAPDTWPEGSRPKWNGFTWTMSGSTAPELRGTEEDPVEKLARFLQANPDVAALIGQPGNS